jgi:hypothetical protein
LWSKSYLAQQKQYVEINQSDSRMYYPQTTLNRGIRLYNKVPDYIKKLDKDKAFKRELFLSVTTGILFSG